MYFLFGPVFLQGIFINDLNRMQGLGLKIDAFVAFGKPTCVM
jgi:hypothetical protein